MVGYAVIAFEADKVGSGIHQPEVAFDDLVRYAQVRQSFMENVGEGGISSVC